MVSSVGDKAVLICFWFRAGAENPSWLPQLSATLPIWNTTAHNIAQYCTILHNIEKHTQQHNITKQHNIAQYFKKHNNTILQHSTTLHNIAKHTQQHNITKQHNNISKNTTTQQNIAQYCKTHTTTQYYNTAQHCTILQNTHNSTILNTTQHSTILQKNRTQYTTHWTILQKHNNNTNVYEHKTQNPVMSKHKIWTENSADSAIAQKSAQ